MTTYGVFTISRQDIVDLSMAIARTIPSGFMNDRNAPVKIAVNGSFGSGKKIIADYGRDQVFGVESSELEFGINEDTAKTNRLTTLFGQKSDVYCHGVAEYDEYTHVKLGNNPYEVTFINMAWFKGYSPCVNLIDDDEKLQAHFDKRQQGGIAYIHNGVIKKVHPDIEIRIETESFFTTIDNEMRHCCDVSSAVEAAVDTDLYDLERDWLRYVEVKVNNQAIDSLGSVTAILKEKFGFVPTSDLPSSVFTVLRAEEAPVNNNAPFPLVKGHHHKLA